MKAGTTTKMVLNTITTGVMVQAGKTWGNLMVDLTVTCDKLQDRGERILRATLGVEAGEARRLLDAAGGRVKTALVMGRLGVERAEAEKRIAEAGGRLSDVTGEAAP
jgi:N-acetylmuramic acid 6-phosphate etherase